MVNSAQGWKLNVKFLDPKLLPQLKPAQEQYFRVALNVNSAYSLNFDNKFTANICLSQLNGLLLYCWKLPKLNDANANLNFGHTISWLRGL